MSGINRGPGGGPKRRIRTTYRTVGNTLLVMPNRSNKAKPANWRELLSDTLTAVCQRPPKHFFPSTPGLPHHILLPLAIIPLGSGPASPIMFTLSHDPATARLQKRAIDWALSRSDVNGWPVPKPSNHPGKGGEQFVNTGLYLRDQLVGDVRHIFNAFRLDGHPDISWRHLSQYTARRDKAEFLGVKTTCGKPCPCRRTIVELWPLGWEMHY